MFNIKRKIQQFIIKIVVEDIQRNGQTRRAIKSCAEGVILKEVKKK